jgi:hypothetical protein
MKNLIILIALSLSLILAACSNTEEGVISPVSPELEKGFAENQSYPYELYKTFPELKSAVVNWKNDRDGIIITVNDRSAGILNKNLFAVIEYVGNKGTTMAYLGNSGSGGYYVKGFNEKEINTISVFYSGISLSAANSPIAISNSQLYKNLEIRGWSDTGAYVRISSHPFSSRLKHLFAQLITSEGNQLIFLGKPKSETFEFPKPGKFSLRDIRLFTYQ